MLNVMFVVFELGYRVKYVHTIVMNMPLQEDAHAVVLDVAAKDAETKLDGSHVYPKTSLFAVFDGHGGKEVAQFCAAHIAETLTRTGGFHKGDMTIALKEAFLQMDDIMIHPDHEAELRALKGGDEENENGEGGSKRGETAMMWDSAQLPEAFLEAFGVPKDKGFIFKVVKSSDGQLNIQNVLDSEGNEITMDDSDEMDSDEPVEAQQQTREESQAKRKRGSGIEGPFDNTPKDSSVEADPIIAAVDEAVEKQEPLELEELSSSRVEEEWKGPAAGCTAVCALIRNDELIVANAGDSRCVLSRGGKAVALTEDHKPMNEEEFSRITKAGGFVADGRVNGSLNLSRALGDLEYKQVKSLPPEEQMVTANPEIRSIQLESDDEFLILACDGIWDVLSNQEAVDFVRERLLDGKSPKDICEEACDFCLAPDTSGCGKGCDNMSIIVSVLKDSMVGKKTKGT